MVEIRKNLKLTLILCILLFSISALTALVLGDIENFLNWNENDSEGKLSRTSTRSTWTDLTKNDTAYLYESSYTYFDFTHTFDFQVSTIDVNNDTENSSVDSVVLYMRVRGSTSNWVQAQAYLWNGTDWDTVLSFGCMQTAWEWRWTENLVNHPILSGGGYGNFSTISKVNNAKLKVMMQYKDPANTEMRMTYACLEVKKGTDTWILPVNAYWKEGTDTWGKVGEEPYLWSNDGDTSYIWCIDTPNTTQAYYFEDLPKGLVSLWIVSENPTTFYNTTTKFLHVSVYDVGSSNTTFKIFMGGSESGQNVSSTTFNVTTTYYVTVNRASTSSFSCSIYSDSDRVSLIETLTATLIPPNQIEYAYVQVTISMCTEFEGTDQSDGYVQNTDIGLEYEKPPLDKYSLPIIGLAGLILMVWCPTWVALTFRKRGIDEKTVETFGYALLLFLLGFGMFITWLWT